MFHRATDGQPVCFAGKHCRPITSVVFPVLDQCEGGRVVIRVDDFRRLFPEQEEPESGVPAPY